MNKQELPVTLNGRNFLFTNEDRIYSIIYRLYCKQLEPLVDEFIVNLYKDLKLIPNVKELIKLKGMLKFGARDCTPEEVADLIYNKLEELRKSKACRDPFSAILDIQGYFEEKGQWILTELSNNKNISEVIDIKKKIKEEIKCYRERRYESDPSKFTMTQEEYDKQYFQDYELNHFNSIVMENQTGNPNEYDAMFSEYVNQFADYRFYGDDELEEDEAKKDLDLRIDYLSNPRKIELEYDLYNVIEYCILKTVECYMKMFNLEEWSYGIENYDKSSKFIKKFCMQKENRKDLALDALEQFPFSDNVYRLLLMEFGDSDGSITKIAEFLNIDITSLKKELFDEYIKNIPEPETLGENKVKFHLNGIKAMKKYMSYDVETLLEPKLLTCLDEIDLMLRTVKGVVYDTREEARNVENDYILLEKTWDAIDYSKYNLLNDEGIRSFKDAFYQIEFRSTAFSESKDKYLSEFIEPRIGYYIQLQRWKEEYLTSQQPWQVLEMIIQNASLKEECKYKIKYGDFIGVKKYPPHLEDFERPIMYLKESIFGWSEYYVLTNKRVIYIKKTFQDEIVLSEAVNILYENNGLEFIGACDKKIRLYLPCDDEKKITKEIELIISLLKEADDTKFSFDKSVFVQSTGGVTDQIKNIFAGIGKINFGNKKEQAFSGNIEDHSSNNEFKYCMNCGAKIKKDDRFCFKCGTKQF